MLELRPAAATAGARREVDIVKTIATLGNRPESGIADLDEAIERHRAQATGEDAARRTRERTRAHVAELVRGMLADRVDAIMETLPVDDAQAHYSAAEAIIARL